MREGLGRYEFWVWFYLALPVIIFLLAWCPIYVSAPTILFGIGSIYTTKENVHFNQERANWKTQLLLIAFVALVTVLSGQGELSYQTFDHVKHNLLFGDLIEEKWPVVYEDGSSLNYYLGYYMVPAAFTKVLPNVSASFFVFVWTFLGFLLGTLGVFKAVGSKWLLLVSVLLFAGFDFIPAGIDAMIHASEEPVYASVFDHIGRWIKLTDLRTEITPIAIQFKWVPQHVIPGLLAIGVLIRRPLGTAEFTLFFLIVMFWSVFTAFGVAVVWVSRLILEKKMLRVSSRVLFCLPLMVVLGIFFASHGDLGKTWMFSWKVVGLNVLASALTALVVLVPLWILQRFIENKTARRKTFLWSLVFLMVYILFGALGQFDLLVRGSFPLYLMVLVLTSVESWKSVKKKSSRYRMSVVFVFLVCSGPSIAEFVGKPLYRSKVLRIPTSEDFQIQDAEGKTIHDLDCVLHEIYGTSENAVAHKQYLGKPNAVYRVFFKEGKPSKGQ